MYILGDIGNSETKIYLVGSNNRVIKDISFPTNKINNKICENKNEISNWGNELIWSFLERYKRF